MVESRLLLMFEAPAKQWLITVSVMSRSGTFLLSSVFLQEIIFSVKFFARV